MSKSFNEQWPLWPPNYDSPLRLVDVRVKVPVDKLFKLLYAPGSEYVARSQEVRGNKDYVESPWLASAEELSALPHLSAPAPMIAEDSTMDTADFKGKLRKTSCSSFGMGLKFRTEEVQRCMDSQSGLAYEVEVCVATTATYGDKFRGVCRHRLKADGPQWSTWKAEFALVYVAPVNGFLKKAIEKGSAGGLAKNFATLVEVLGEFGEVTKPQQEQGAAAGAPPEVTQPQGQPRVLGILDEGFVRLFEPLAATILRTGAQQGAAASEVSRTATAIAVLVLLIILQCLLAIVRIVLGSFRVNPGWLGIPGSVSGVVFSIAVFVLVQRGAPFIAAGVPSLVGRLPRFQKLRRNSRSLPSGADADAPAKGTRFEGFDAALESANADITSGEQELRAASLANVALQRTAPAREQLRTGVKGFQKLMADTWTAGRRRMANGAQIPERAISPVRQGGANQRLSPSRGSSPLPTSPTSESEDANALSDDALLRRSPSSRRRRANRRSEKALMKSFNAASGGSGDEADGQDKQRSVEMSPMGLRPASLTSQTSSLSEFEGAGPVEAEVFENERFLPFRGWGHQWPGHLLPTDRVGHWSLRGDGPSGAESMDFHNVAPGLREGWEWLEEDWHIDMTGHEEGCVDDEGWYYAVDFNWLKHPPQPGAGRFKRVRDYVRRRRWVRTRVRSEALMASDGALQRLASLSQPPPLLPLTELLGDLAVTPKTQPLPQGGSASSEPGNASKAHDRPPFELRPAPGPRMAGELQTPRLVMRSSGQRSPSSDAGEGPVLLFLSVAAPGDAMREAGIVAVRLTLRQEQAAPMPPASKHMVRQPLPAAGGSTEGESLVLSGRCAEAAEKESTTGPTDLASPAVGEGHAGVSADHQTVSPLGEEASTGGAESSSVRNSAAVAAEDGSGEGNAWAQYTDPFAAAAIPLRTRSSAEVGPPQAATVRCGDAAAVADGLLASDLEQVELQIAASMQPSSEDGSAAEKLHASGSHHSDHAHDLSVADPLSPTSAEEPAGSDGRDSRQVAYVSEGTGDPGAECDTDTGQHTQDSLSREQDTAVTAELQLPPTSLSTTAALNPDSKDAEAKGRSERAEEEDSPGTKHLSSGAAQKRAAKEHGDWEHVKDASDGDTDDSGVVVHHEHASQTEDGTLLATDDTSSVPQVSGCSAHGVLDEASPESAAHPTEVQPVGPPPATAQSTDAVTAGGTVQQALFESGPSASAPEASSTSDKDRHATPERRPHEGLHLFPRPAGDSSPGPSPGAVDWSQIGKQSGRLAAMAGDSLRKGFAQAASHASQAARQSGKGEPWATSPPVEKLQDLSSGRSGTPPGRERQASSPSFLQSLKSRGEQSLHAARSVLSPEATAHKLDGAASSDGGAATAEGTKAEPAALGSMRGILSDLKRTMERVGHAAPLMNMASFGKQEAPMPLPRTSSEAEGESSVQPDSTNVTAESDGQAAPDLVQGKVPHASPGTRQQAGKVKES